MCVSHTPQLEWLTENLNFWVCVSVCFQEKQQHLSLESLPVPKRTYLESKHVLGKTYVWWLESFWAESSTTDRNIPIWIGSSIWHCCEDAGSTHVSRQTVTPRRSLLSMGHLPSSGLSIKHLSECLFVLWRILKLKLNIWACQNSVKIWNGT